MINYMRLLAVAVFLVTATIGMNGCSGSESAWRYDPGIPGQVTGVTAESGDSLVTLSWQGNPVATSYNIYYVSELTENGVTKTNSLKINVTTTSQVITGLNNNIKYYFIVTALNRDGEGIASVQVSAIPSSISNADLVGTWYFHTLITGPEAGWERGTITVDENYDAVISDYETSASENGASMPEPPAGFNLSVNGNGVLSQSGPGSWIEFHGIMGSRKNMMVVTSSPTLMSRAITIFQKKKNPSDPDYSIADIMGTGSDQNTNNPTLLGNGPTRFAYHQLYSGSNTEWEYSNCKVGQNGNVWTAMGDYYKDVTYWDYGSPAFKVAPKLDFLWKVTSVGIDKDGLLTEYWNFDQTGNFNNLVIRNPHEIVFRGRMSADKTVVVGVGTRTDMSGNNPQYFLRIMELCFKPTDQSLPKPSLNDLAGNFKFHKIGYKSQSNGIPGVASWAYGSMQITGSGYTTFTEYVDSAGNSPDAFTLSYYPDPGIKAPLYTDFANFTTPALAGGAYYYDANGVPYHTYYDFWSYPSTITDPSTWRQLAISPYYFNEHGSLSYNRDMFVLTRTDSSGNSLIIGLK